MSENLEIYKCDICGNIVEIIHSGNGTLVCCGEEMKLQKPFLEDEGTEKHLPVVEFEEGDCGRIVRIKVGEVEHPMVEEHFIRFIEAISNDQVYLKRKMLSPGEHPVLEMKCNCNSMLVREYCNIHGLWQIQV